MTRYEQSLAACEDSGQRGVASYLRDLKASHDRLSLLLDRQPRYRMGNEESGAVNAALKAAEALR